MYIRAANQSVRPFGSVEHVQQMKAFFRISILISFLWISGTSWSQVNPEDGQWASTTNGSSGPSKTAAAVSAGDPIQEFIRKAKSLDVAVRPMELQGSLAPGYYLITGVFSVGKNLKREVRDLSAKNWMPEVLSTPRTI